MATRSARISLLLFFLLTLPMAARLKVTAKAHPDFDASLFETWAWGPAQKRPPGSPLEEGGVLDVRVRARIREDLADRGYREAGEAAAAGFLVVYRTASGDSSDVGRPDGSMDGWVDLHHGGTSVAYSKGTLFIDLLDPSTGEARWSGWVEGVAPQPEDLVKKIDKAVDKLLAKVPKRN